MPVHSATVAVSRRHLVKTLTVASSLCIAPTMLQAQTDRIRLGTLTPLTGSGGAYGPAMAKIAKAVVDQVNAAGGVLGMRISLTSEDDQSSPEAAVRAARKLIDVDHVSAIIGTWASSVTMAVAPLCWESKTFLATVSGSDTITQLPHQGYIIRTQPKTSLQGQKFGEFAIELGCKRAYFVTPQTPYVDAEFSGIKAGMENGGGTAERLVYDDQKSSYRSEVDLILRARPDVIILGGYATDTAVLLRDIYRSGYSGKLEGYYYSLGKQVIDALPPDATNGAYIVSRSPAIGSSSYKQVVKLMGNDNPDTTTCEVYDQVNMILIAMAAAKATTGEAIKNTIRQISQGGGLSVDNALDGIRAVTAGKKVDYDGASGPCTFDKNGDIEDASFRYDQIRNGKPVLLKAT